ncbi:MAG: ABC transporter permease [Alphaproteobacteria bacterium]|nr:ABC transporter permease [Alphaproteobacteria bacterium]
MSLVAFLGAIETGLIFGLVSLGVFLTFRVLNFPDLTVDGSFAFGAAVTAVLIVKGWNPWVATAVAIVAGAGAGLITATLNLRLRVLNLLASILTMIALYSVNIRVMSGPTVPLLGQKSVLSSAEGLGLPNPWLAPLFFLTVTAAVWCIYAWFLHSETGLAMRATGANPVMARANGVRTERLVLMGLAISNGLAAFGGSLLAQLQGAADVTMGIGTIIVGLAAVIGGGALIPARGLVGLTLSCVFGAIVYHVIVALALNATALGLTASDVNIVTAALVCVALAFSGTAAGAGRAKQP